MTTLLLIDVQNDFHPGGSLAIPTASDDAARIASFINRHGESINRIVVTLDTHPKWHIAHPTFWTTGAAAADGGEGGRQYQHPEPFTVISSGDIRSKKWIPRPDPSQQRDAAVIILDPTIFAKGGDIPDDLFSNENDISSSSSALDLTKYCEEYAHRLESSKCNHRKFSLTIWPEHCIIGSDGHEIVDVVARAISTWRGEDDTTEEGTKKERTVEYIRKGMNPYTEMFSAICAEVPVDSSTSFNYALVDSVSREEEVIVMMFELICSSTFFE